MSEKPFEPQTAIFTPPQVSAAGVAAIERMKSVASRTLSIGIPVIREYFAPMLPGQVCAVIAQTSNYKSGFLHHIEHLMAEQLQLEKRDEVLAHVSVEEGIEEQAFYEFARESGENPGSMARGEVQDWNRLMQAASRVGTIPIFRIGDSLARAEDAPNLYLSNMIRSLRYLQQDLLGKPIKFAALFFDYLQAFPIDPETKSAVHDQQRRLQVRSDIYRLRQAASYFQCPVFVAVQAKQKLDGAAGPNMLIPGIYDGEESSSIAQRCDRVISLWMPKQTHSINSTIEHKGFSFVVKENLLYVKVCKQRGGLPSGRTWRCEIDFLNNSITPDTDVQ
jgi:replicative DNA helicase